jgi:heat shock protein 5
MVKEAEEFAEEDRMVKDRIDARNGLESYLFNLKNTLEDENIAGSLAAEEKKELKDMVEESLDWLEENNPTAVKEDYDSRQKEVEQVAMPMMRKLYSGGGSNEDAGADDFGDDEL